MLTLQLGEDQDSLNKKVNCLEAVYGQAITLGYIRAHFVGRKQSGRIHSARHSSRDMPQVGKTSRALVGKTSLSNADRWVKEQYTDRLLPDKIRETFQR